MKKLNAKAMRAVLWNILYYAACFFAIFYLKDKPEILNWDVAAVFLPLIFLACSTEIFSKGKGKADFKPWNYFDFAAKVLAYVMAQLIFRRIVPDELLWLCAEAFVTFLALSAVCCFIMIIISKKS